MAQRFIPQIDAGDKRILVIGGKPVPFALARIPQGNEVRGNLAAGGLGRAQPLSERDRMIGETVGAKLADRGLLLIGVDSIGDYLTEVNVTSPTCFAEIRAGRLRCRRSVHRRAGTEGGVVIGLIVIGHSPFAAALHDCARHVYGCEPERCIVLDVLPDADVEAEIARARQAVSDVDTGDGVLVLVDMFGATPGNIAAQLAQPGRVEVVAGVNLPMLMRTLCYRERTKIGDMPEKALGGGASGMMKIASTAPQNQRPLYPSPFPHDPHSTDGGPTDGSSRLQDQ